MDISSDQITGRSVSCDHYYQKKPLIMHTEIVMCVTTSGLPGHWTPTSLQWLQ